MLSERAGAWNELALGAGSELDLLVIGGGVTGAAILFEAARRGLRAALVERNDFASGTSSRSSKLIHGGLRYLKEGKIGLTRESVRERQELLRDAPGLVDPIAFVMPHYRGRKPSRATLAFGLAAYDALAGSWQHKYLDREQTLSLVPSLETDGLQGAHRYTDATTDDARLVLRLLGDAHDAGAIALNYVDATELLGNERVVGARLVDAIDGRAIEVRARAVIAATGVFADELREHVGQPPRLRPLRGSHLIVENWRLPLPCAVAFEHPKDSRPVFAYPWLGQTLVGTTDLDHMLPLDNEPSMSREELHYLLNAVQFQFPSTRIGAGDVVATYAGIRPVVEASRDAAPSKVSRDHAVWNERGLVTITGGKLTTFRPMALDALRAAAPQLPPFDVQPRRIFEKPGRYGAHESAVTAAAGPGELDRIGSTPFRWVDLRWAARHEAVVHLEDLLMRRTRIGLLVRDGGEQYFDRIGSICRDELGWTQSRWSDEARAYVSLRQYSYGLPYA